MNGTDSNGTAYGSGDSVHSGSAGGPSDRRDLGMTFDITCLVHGRKLSEHQCLYCALCYKTLTIEECHIMADGQREDVCDDCAKTEAAVKARIDAGLSPR